MKLMNLLPILLENEVEASFCFRYELYGDNLDEIATALMESSIVMLLLCHMKNKKETVRIFIIK